MGCGSAEDTGANQEQAAAITPALPWKKDARARHQAGGGGGGGAGGQITKGFSGEASQRRGQKGKNIHISLRRYN